MAALVAQLAQTAAGTGIPGVPVIPTPASAQASGQSAIKTFLTQGFDAGWIGMAILAGIIPFVPFSFLGYGGANLMATGAYPWAMMKAAVQLMCVTAHKYLTLYYPSLWWIAALILYNPWYIFDILQLFNPLFGEEGFKVPFTGKKIGNPGAAGKINGIVFGYSLMLFSMGGYTLTKLLPPEIAGPAKPTLELIFKIVGGATALAGGGIMSYVLLPQLLASAKGDVMEIQAAIAAQKPAASAPAPAIRAPTVVGQRGGGFGPAPPTTGNPGGVFPTLSQVATQLMGAYEPGAPYKAGVMSGGGAGPSAALPSIFVGGLALAALGGISLALVRSKGASSASVE